MLTIKNLSLLPNRKVIVDVAQSNALPTPDSYSPYPGVQTQFIKFIGRNLETTGNIYAMLAAKDDFDADKVKPKYNEEDYDGEDCRLENDGVPYDPAVHPLNHVYYRRLEDIASAYVTKYVENLAYSLVRYDTGGIREYNREHPVQPTFISTDDSDDVTEFADLQTFEPIKQYSNEVIVEAHKQLPFVLKRLHMMSKCCGIHMVTYVVSYYRAFTKNTAAKLRKTTTASLKANRVIEEGVYLCDAKGSIKKQVEVKNKNQKALKMFDWITGDSHEFESYRKDAYDFLHYCQVLNVDLMEDDFTKYTPEFYENLTVLTVTSNTQYNDMIKQAIYSNSVREVVQEKPEIKDLIVHVTKLFQEGIVTNETLRNWAKVFDTTAAESALSNYQTIMMIYNAKNGLNQNRTTDYYYENGLLTVRGKIVQIPAYWLCEWENMETQVVFHELGYILLCMPGTALTVLQSNEALENAKKHLGDVSELKVEWRQLFI